MKTKPLYLVASRRGPSPRNRQRRSHLRLVHPSVAPQRRARLSAAAPTRHAPPRLRSRPLGQRLLQAASDGAMLCVALLVGLLPNS